MCIVSAYAFVYVIYQIESSKQSVPFEGRNGARAAAMPLPPPTANNGALHDSARNKITHNS